MVQLPALGNRGQGWVWGQFILGAVVIVASALGPVWPWSWLRLLGLLLAVLGAAFGTWSLFSLGDSLTPYPTPRNRATLIVHGPYRVVRHPIYSSLLLAMLGICFTGSWWGFVPLALLVLWWLAKAQVEESHLRERYPGYDDYCRQVRARLIPFIL